MKYTSIIRIALFAFALYANFVYTRFLFNPLHAENILLYALALIADGLTILLLSYTWISCLFFELSKGKYYSEIEHLMMRGRDLINKSVAVLIPTTTEPISIIRKTLEGVIAMEGKKHIYLLDDGNRDELRKLSEQLGIKYLRRPHKKYNKSGNLNHAIAHVQDEFIAVFDADFIPKKHFLTATLPLFSDKTVGIVQTPQVYYNEDTFFAKGFKNFQNLFYQYIMPAKSLQHSAICVGTNVVYRKTAVQAIGGIPLVDHSEDVNTSLRMYEHNYRTLYLNRTLAKGLSPESVISFFNQQFRWAKGGLTMLFKHNTLFNRKLNWDQRLQFFFSNLFYLSGIAIVIYLLIPLLAIIFNSSAINPDFFSELVTVYSMFFFANFVFYTSLVRNNFLQSIALGVFCFIPYTKAINSVLFNRRFSWKATNAKSSDIVTKLVAPFFPYLMTSIALAYLFLSGFLPFQMTFFLYAFWIVINSLIILYLIINAYLSVVQKRKESADGLFSNPVMNFGQLQKR